MSSPRPQRKATKRLYANDGAPAESDVEMSEGEQATRRGGRGVNKGKGKGKPTKSRCKAAVVASDGEQEEQDELDSSSEVEQPTKKRKKATKKQRKTSKQQQKKGKLELINTLPVELFAEICSHLGPGDLLALSLTSKAFRSSLISPGSLSLWKASRRSLGLPDLTAGDMTEAQYAHLVFGTRCDSCGCKETKLADFYLRKFLCNRCRQKNWVKLGWSLKHDYPDLHPFTSRAALATPHSAAERRFGRSMRYGFLPDLETISAKLSELNPEAKREGAEDREQDQDEDEDEKLLRELLEDDEGFSTSALNSTRSRQSRRPERYGTTTSAPAQASPTPEPDDEQAPDSDDELRLQAQAELEDFLEERDELRLKRAKDGAAILAVAKRIKRAQREEHIVKKDAAQEACAERREAIEEKVLEMDKYTRDCFGVTGTWYTSKIVNSTEPLSDEGWEEIKPKVVKLLARIKSQQEQAEVANEQQARQAALLERYEKLLDIQPDDESRHWLPLFADFLHLASVKELWETDEVDPEDDEVWGEHLDAILEELDDYRIDVRLQAVQTILAATTEMIEEELDGDADSFGPDSYDDEWLARPVSFLVCNVPHCRKAPRWDGRRIVAGRPTFFGSLPDLLAHQHEHHSDFSLPDKQRKKREQDGVVGHFHLPPLVVSALSTIIELAGVEDEEATVEDLVDATRSTAKPIMAGHPTSGALLVWENCPGARRYFSEWTDVIEEGVRQSERSVKTKRILEVPTIRRSDPDGDRQARMEEMEQTAKRGKGKKAAKKQGGTRNPWDYD